MGSRAFSHESVFIPEDSVEKLCSEQTMSQENVSDKVRNLQVSVNYTSIHAQFNYKIFIFSHSEKEK
uniref:Uncharacterized protein n=1 Tax=Pygocentrus nattereri TaxID=42514 RepID=A0AAR2KMI0_PYGNA